MNRETLVLAASILLLATSATAGEAQLQALATDAVRVLQEYVRVDTTNPPGNETRGVEFLAKILDAAEVDYETAESAPGRGNIWARLEGGDEPAITQLTHDLAGVFQLRLREEWQFPNLVRRISCLEPASLEFEGTLTVAWSV